jgi:hypothetical protein
MGMLWSTVKLIGARHGLPASRQLVQSIGGDIVSYVNSHQIRKELNTHICAVADVVQDFAYGGVLVKTLEIVFEIFPFLFSFFLSFLLLFECSNT